MQHSIVFIMYVVARHMTTITMYEIGKLTYIVQGLCILIKVARLTQTKW